MTAIPYPKRRKFVTKATKLQETALLGIFASYLILGNLPRIISVGGFTNNLLITEGLLYFAAATYALLHSKALAFVLKYLSLPFAVILASFLRGVVEFGFELQPFLFAVRLIALLFSGAILATVLKRKFEHRLSEVFNYFILTYLATALLALVIFILFPDSVSLWNFLSRYKVEFLGDPHQSRLVSSYLDPNYYAAIATLPVVLGALNFKYVGKYRYALFILLLTLTIVLTISRSGLATWGALFAFILFQESWRVIKRSQSRLGLVLFIPLTLLGAVLASPLYIASVSRVVERTFAVTQDPSALARLSSFHVGWDLFVQYPLLGLGYNYLSVYTKATIGKSSVDSSVLAILINFGLLASLLLGLLAGFWLLATYRKTRRANNVFYTDSYVLLCLYLFVVFAFTSQFNNLLFYQFWLLPVTALLTYLSIFPNPKRPDANTDS